MSQENVELVRNIYQAAADRDLESARELTDPELEWISDPRVGQLPVRGRENVVKFMLDQEDAFEELETVPERYLDRDDLVLVYVHVTARGRASGVEVEIRIGHLWTVRDGLAIRVQAYGDRAEALAAAGLSE